MTYPNIQRRNLLQPTEAGERVRLRDLWMTFSPHEWSRWNRQSVNYEHDEHGLLPASVEVFLRPRQKELFDECA
jgi:hypothetical protein